MSATPLQRKRSSPFLFKKKGRGQNKSPNDIHKSLNESATDKIRKLRSDYNNNPPTVVSIMPAVDSTSGRLHSEFVRLLFLQTHWETDRFFTSSGVQLVEGEKIFRRGRKSSWSRDRSRDRATEQTRPRKEGKEGKGRKEGWEGKRKGTNGPAARKGVGLRR
jgi:hypothetical protein